jgi:hypothetical protein
MHDKRREGYPNGQTMRANGSHLRATTCHIPANGATSRQGLPCAKDAISRPEKPDVKTLSSALFLPGAEKSSIKSTA